MEFLPTTLNHILADCSHPLGYAHARGISVLSPICLCPVLSYFDLLSFLCSDRRHCISLAVPFIILLEPCYSHILPTHDTSTEFLATTLNCILADCSHPLGYALLMPERDFCSFPPYLCPVLSLF
ncbi:hypothetical protein RJT34_18900 [Clitoria ternatea]|uniref:Uncharacterized protein n=1 Tax=Clitoria ternatea TaxID=43366 RepID=A0AAN9IQ84_CLITE